VELGKILVGTDQSAAADLAVERASALAEQHGGELLVISVLDLEAAGASRPRSSTAPAERPPATLWERETARLSARVDAAVDGRKVKPRVALEGGKPFLTILRRAQSEDVDVIVVGAHGRDFLRDLFLGSTAEKILRKGDRPVLVVKNKPQGPYRRVLIPVDFSETSRRALEAAVRAAPDAELHVLHVYHPWYEDRLASAGVEPAEVERYHEEQMREVHKQMDEFLRGSSLAGRPVERLIKLGYPSEAIRNSADEFAVDLIAIGTHGRTLLHSWLIGSVTVHILNEARSDVLAIPPEPSAFKTGG
jgi:nucleotide-binding universal stress UspA family protein